MRALFTLWLGWCAALSAAPAVAEEVTLEASPAVQCLSPRLEERTPIVYPARSLERRDGGAVQVELLFNAPDQPPRVKVLDRLVERELIGVVKEHVEQLRVPCMQRGTQAVRLRMDFVFRPNDGRKVITKAPIDLDDERREALGKCLRHVDGRDLPEYPVEHLQAGKQGKVYVRLTFVDKDLPPRLEAIASSDSRFLWRVTKYAEGLRLPCLDREPLSWTRLYSFTLLGGERTLLQDTTLSKLLAHATLPKTPVHFDFGDMQCPFDLRVTYRRPFDRNSVKQVETDNPARQPLMDWLGDLQLNISGDVSLRVLGDIFNLSVPCGTLDL